MDKKDLPHSIDLHVGRRLQLRRKLVGLSQEQLAESLNLTFQQIQKYESAANRISASRLWEISKILKVPISYFFEEMDEATASHPFGGFGESGQQLLEGVPDRRGEDRLDDAEFLERRETLELIRAYYHIRDTKQRRSLFDLIKGIGRNQA